MKHPAKNSQASSGTETITSTTECSNIAQPGPSMFTAQQSPQLIAETENTGNLIIDIAHEVESMTKVKALNEADRLSENIETNYLKLGGILKLIKDNSWLEGFPTFDDFVFEKYGFRGRKGAYLIDIYTHLVTKQIPWDKVAHIGWTKLKDLALILTPENIDEWVEKAKKLTVAELHAALKAGTPEGVKMSFKFKLDQADVVNQAIAKAKGELKTEFATVAIENICAGYVGGNSVVAKLPPTFEEIVSGMGLEPALQRIAELYPEWDITVGAAVLDSA